MKTALGSQAWLLTWLTALLGVAGCSTSHATKTGGGGGSGGAEATGGAGGVDVDAGPACVVADPSQLPGRILAANPLVSAGRPVVASSGVTNKDRLVDGVYGSSGNCIFGVPTESAPAWAAIDLVPGPSRVLLIWKDRGTAAYTEVRAGAPLAYQIETSGDSPDGIGGTWTTVATVTDNPVHIREHAFDFTGQRWVKLVVTAAQPLPDGGVSDAGPGYPVGLDEITVFDVSAADGGLPTDTWFFMGDSITQGAFARNIGAGKTFDEVEHAMRPDYFPAMVNGGITSEAATHGVKHVTDDHFLELNPDLLHVLIGYGTNDSWGNKDPVKVGFEATMESLISAVLAAGRVPILARIPYACEPQGQLPAHQTIPQFNAIIDRLQAAHGLPCGPDLYGYFAAHQDELADCVHPTGTGYQAMNRLWAEAAAVLYPPN